MNLIYLKKFVPSRIFKRGESYYHNEQVLHIKQKLNKTKGSTFHAEVMGTKLYSVEIEVNDQLDVLSSYCDCPYAQKDFCKHQVALCLVVLDTVAAPETSKESKPPSVQTVHYEDVLDKNELSQSKTMVQSSINSAKQRGFINYSQSFKALHGAEQMIRLIDQYTETKRYQMAVTTGLQTLQPVVKALQFTDDSSGNFGDVIKQLLSQIHYAISSGAFSWSSSEQTDMLKQMIKSSQNKIYTDWSDWKFELLTSAILLCEDEKRFHIMSQHLQLLEAPLHTTSDFMNRFEFSQLKIVQFNLLSIRQDDQAIEEFLQQNLQLNAIKEIAMDQAVVSQKFDKAMEIAVSGEREHAEYPGLVDKWRIHQYKLHKMMNHLPNQKELAFQLVTHGNIEFFNDLKELYSLDEWPEVLENLLSNLNTPRYYLDYTTILKQENLFSRVLDHCQDNLHDVPEHAQWLKAVYPNETKELYMQWLLKRASGASTRPNYRQVCREIKTFKKVFGDEATGLLVDTLQNTYPQRSAFLDELSKI
ncbi:MAG TPA: SWIM zinc finger family protein [Paenisporosarcina sp.]|nr:SWIM zinc finger family protein [Paenisporosarcina sp.]